MKGRRVPKLNECVYCGQLAPRHDDHVPPKNLWGKPRPSNLIVVPSCYDCNNKASKDDEYFRTMLAIRFDTTPQAVNSGAWDAAIRSLSYPEQAGFTKHLLNSMRLAELCTRAGLYLGNAMTYDVQLERVNRVATRIVNGLFFHETGRRLAAGYDAAAYCLNDLKDLDPDTSEQIKQIVDVLLAQTARVIDSNVFSYRLHIPDEDPDVTAWLFLIYKNVAFLGLTGPKDQMNITAEGTRKMHEVRT